MIDFKPFPSNCKVNWLKKTDKSFQKTKKCIHCFGNKALNLILGKSSSPPKVSGRCHSFRSFFTFACEIDLLSSKLIDCQDIDHRWWSFVWYVVGHLKTNVNAKSSIRRNRKPSKKKPTCIGFYSDQENSTHT